MNEKEITDAIVAEYIKSEKSPGSEYAYVEIRSDLLPPEKRMRIKRNRKALKGRKHIDSELVVKEALETSKAINMTYSSGVDPSGAIASVYGRSNDVKEAVVNGIYKWARDNGYEIMVEEDTLI